MAIQPRLRTLEEFKAFALLPENSDREFEFINGEIIEVSPGRTSNSEIAQLIAVAVHLFCRSHSLQCHTSGGDGAYQILDNVIVPDFAYKHGPMSDDYPDPIAPEWAVEIISPTDKAIDIADKRQTYLEAGILLWEIYPKAKRVDVYAPGQAPRSVGMDGVLDGGDVLPGFTIAVKDLFPS